MAQEIADSTLLDTWGSGGNIVEPDISKIIEGWQLGEQPPHEYMNWLQNTFGSKLNHILKNGVASWNNTTPYLAGSSVQHNGNVWLCKTTNTNSTPTDANSNWKRIITVESLPDISNNYVALTGNQIITGIKTFNSIITGSITGNAETVTNGVYTTGNQIITGIKTFSSSPIVPTPTTGTQVANKDYVDSSSDRIGLIDYGYIAKPYHIVAFGGEFNRADYPKLWAYLQANPSLVKTQAQWTTEATANGGICGYFSSGNETTTFRVPNLDKAFLRPDSRTVGSFQGDAFQGHFHNIIGQNLVGTGGGIYGPVGNNTYTTSYNLNYAAATPISDGTNGTPRTANETRPKNIAVLPLIVAK